MDSPISLLRLLIALFVLFCLCACLGCGGYGYRRRYVIRRVEYVQPTTTVVAPAAGRLYMSRQDITLVSSSVYITQKIKHTENWERQCYHTDCGIF